MNLRMLEQRAFDVEPLYAQLEANPHVWNAITLRTAPKGSPHREVSDIWVRYNPIDNYRGDIRAFNEEHTPEWYPVARELTEAQTLAESLAMRMDSDIGAVLITKIRAGGQVYPHIDQGWHARTFEKYAIQVRGNAAQAFHFQDEVLSAEAGDLWWFDNSAPHWVTNDSDIDRITLIICLRRRTCQ